MIDLCFFERLCWIDFGIALPLWLGLKGQRVDLSVELINSKVKCEAEIYINEVYFNETKCIKLNVN